MYSLCVASEYAHVSARSSTASARFNVKVYNNFVGPLGIAFRAQLHEIFAAASYFVYQKTTAEKTYNELIFFTGCHF